MKPEIFNVPVTSANAIALADACARDGGHCAPLATTIFQRDGEIIGAAGVFAPSLTFWARTDLCPRESVDLVFRAKAAADERRTSYLCLCSPESPFRRLMPRFGFNFLGNADFFEVAT